MMAGGCLQHFSLLQSKRSLVGPMWERSSLHADCGNSNLLGAGSTQEADADIQALVDFVKPFVETSKGVNYDRFEAISYRSQVCSRVESK